MIPEAQATDLDGGSQLVTWLTRARSSVKRLELYAFGRWLALASVTGVVAGLGASFLTWGINGLSGTLLGRLAGFLAPASGAEGSTAWHAPTHPWAFLLVLPAAGAAVGWLVYRFAPEAEGHGTDAVVGAFHRHRSEIRSRVVPVKLLASILTIGSGGSAGREGPVAQIGAGFASVVAKLLGMSARDRRTLVLAGVAGGVGGMFRAPLGGALFAIEVLYSENEFESEALIPAVISSIVSYTVSASLTGWGSVFQTTQVGFTHPSELASYLLLGVLLAFTATAYVRVFYAVRDAFRRLSWPLWSKPAAGGLAVAVIALALPQVLGGGYGWLQLTLDGQLSLALLLMLVPAKILATALTIGSGGSGGVFAPSLIIGGMTGAVFAEVAQVAFPSIAPDPASCVLVGMGGFFAGAANVPIAALILVAEMSGSYRLLVPMMLVGSVSFLLTRGVSIYEQQVPGRIDSPAHLGEFEVDVLERMTVSDLPAGTPPRLVRPDTPFSHLIELVASMPHDYFAVVDETERLVGVFSVDDMRTVMATPEVWPALVAGDLGVSGEDVIYLRSDDDLHTALRKFTGFKLAALPVLEGPPPSRLAAVVTYQEVLKAYDQAVRRLQEEAGLR